jgi:hypothetical protein
LKTGASRARSFVECSRDLEPGEFGMHVVKCDVPPISVLNRDLLLENPCSTAVNL